IVKPYLRYTPQPESISQFANLLVREFANEVRQLSLVGGVACRHRARVPGIASSAVGHTRMLYAQPRSGGIMVAERIYLSVAEPAAAGDMVTIFPMQHNVAPTELEILPE